MTKQELQFNEMRASTSLVRFANYFLYMVHQL